MPKNSKNLGIRKACPECKKTAIVDAEFEGKGKFKIFCPHCYLKGKRVLIGIDVNKKTTMELTTKIIIVILLVALSYSIYINISKDIVVTQQPLIYPNE